jgi:serine/threonine protein kinase
MSDLSGRQLGKYELREIIRRGGMSAVYEAYQPSLHRLVAVKVLAFPGDPEFAARFEREARSIAALQHPNVVRVYDYGEQDGQAYLVMQYVEGGVTLVDLLREPQAPVRCLELMEHVLAGLGYAHGQGIVHRDVKPSNVLMASPTWPMLADFGIAKLLAVRGQQLTATGVVAGTPTYMAPEQAFRLSVDTRTDLYSAGVMLYEMVTGRVPFDAGTPVATLMLHAYEPPPPPRELNPALPEELEAMVLKALAKDPADRFQSAEEMGEAIQSLRTVLERPSSRALAPPDPLASAYTSGVRAFSQGRFDQAIRQLEPVAAADPAYEDVQTLLDAARAAHQAQRYTPPVIPSATPGPGTPPRIIPPLGYPPVGAPAPADPTQPTPPPAPGYSPPRAMPPGYPPQDAPVPEPPAAAGSPAPAWPPAGPAGAGSGQPPEQPPPRRGRRGSGGGWFEERRRVAVVVVAVVALLGGSIWGAGLFGANQAQAREIILQARGEAGPNAFTQPVTPTKPKRFGTGAIGTGTNAKQGVLQLHGDQVGLYGGTQNQSTCNRAQMITYLRQSPAKAQAWVAALNSDPTLAWSGGTKLTVAQIPDYINELTPVLLRLDTRVTNNGYRDGHPTPFQAVLQAGTAVLIDKLGVPRSRCACGNPLLEPKDLTKTSQYSGAAWPGFKATTIVTVAPAPKQVTNVMLVDVDKGTNAVFNRTTGTAGGSDVTVKLTNKIKTEINLNLILQTAQVIAPPPYTVPR